jgi:hypothetical protein
MPAYQKLYFVSAHGGTTNDLLYPLLTTGIDEVAGVAHVHTDGEKPCNCGANKYEFHAEGCGACSAFGIFRALNANVEAMIAAAAPKLTILTPLGQGELTDEELEAVRAHCVAGGLDPVHHPVKGDHMHHVARKLHAHHSEGVAGAHAFLKPQFF